MGWKPGHPARESKRCSFSITEKVELKECSEAKYLSVSVLRMQKATIINEAKSEVWARCFQQSHFSEICMYN